MNRLKKATETHSGYPSPAPQTLVQGYDYDRWGNRQINTGLTTNQLNKLQFQITTSNNRLKAPTDTGAANDQMRYDPAGNLIWDGYSTLTSPARDFGYDAEGRIGVVKNGSGTELSRYIYDPDGKRVRRIINGVETWMVYGMGGELIAEYALNANATTPQKEYGYRRGQLLIIADSSNIRWQVPDHLGTPRLILDKTGALANVERHDYLPFGEDIGASLRTSGIGYGADNLRQKFTGYEKDAETGLDFAQARYFANVQGRFTSPDPLMASGNSEDPKTWNRYVYVLNNPANNIDPLGLLTYQINGFEVSRQEFFHHLELGNWEQITFQAGGAPVVVLNKNHYYETRPDPEAPGDLTRVSTYFNDTAFQAALKNLESLILDAEKQEALQKGKKGKGGGALGGVGAWEGFGGGDSGGSGASDDWGATGGQIQNVYNSIRETPNYPAGFKDTQDGLKKVKVKDRTLLSALREIEPGTWKKVYRDGLDANGNKVSLHYFQSQSGKIFDFDVKQDWSNRR